MLALMLQATAVVHKIFATVRLRMVVPKNRGHFAGAIRLQGGVNSLYIALWI